MPHESFLPSEYVEQQRDHRTMIMGIGLFIVMVIAVLAAFLYRQGQLKQVIAIQENVIQRTEEAGLQVAMLTALQQSRIQMHERAELAAALVERVPRSIMLAELIDRMPEGLGLIEFELRSTRVRKPAPVKNANGRRPNGRIPTRNETGQEQARIKVPEYILRLRMKGIAPTDLHVSRFLSSLNDYPLFEGVRLESTEEDLMENDVVRRFEITCALRAGADVRSIEPNTKVLDFIERVRSREEVTW
ncbi:MAG: PilN domain-containing protein [Myxococcota bacterium]